MDKGFRLFQYKRKKENRSILTILTCTNLLENRSHLINSRIWSFKIPNFAPENYIENQEAFAPCVHNEHFLLFAFAKNKKNKEKYKRMKLIARGRVCADAPSSQPFPFVRAPPYLKIIKCLVRARVHTKAALHRVSPLFSCTRIVRAATTNFARRTRSSPTEKTSNVKESTNDDCENASSQWRRLSLFVYADVRTRARNRRK